MSFYGKNTHLDSYVHGTLNNLFASQFLSTNPDSILELKKLFVNIQTKKNKKIHYFYLWLLTGRRPYLAKFNFSWKHTSQNSWVKTKTKRQLVQIRIKEKHSFHFLHEILWQIITKQTHAEKRVCAYKQLDVQLYMIAIPLTQSTLALQALNSYFPNIPLTLQFRFSYATAFQKLFFVRALKLLSHDSKIKGLDLFE
jgi:hypothetical protein